jgi:pilus assembly protein CpaB
MSPRRLILILMALVMSAGTVVVGRTWLHAERPAPAAPVVAAPPKPVPMVLVAKGNLPAGQFVRPENLRWQPWPEDGIAETYVVQGQRALEEFVGAVVRSGLSDGEPIVDGRLVRPGERGFMAAVLAPGNRAVTVPVTAASGNAGFVFPGDRVDILLSFSVTLDAPSGDKDKTVERRASETVLTDVRVLAVDQRSDDQNKEVVVAKTATLEVTPKQAEVIAVAVELGKLTLSLRSLAQDEDAENGHRVSYTWDSDAARLLPPPVAKELKKVSVVRGSEAKDIEVAGRHK